MQPESWKIEQPGSETCLAERMQVPLILAYALSIHKSQGLTIPRLKVDLGQIFEMGQAYVAISRAVSLDTLQIINFAPGRVKCHRKVVDFYRGLIGTGVEEGESEEDEFGWMDNVEGYGN